MIYGQRFRSAITSNAPYYCGMSAVVIVCLDLNLVHTVVYLLFYYWSDWRWPPKPGQVWHDFPLEKLLFNVSSLECRRFAREAEKSQGDRKPETSTWAPSDTQLDFVLPHPALSKPPSASSSWQNWSHVGETDLQLSLLRARLQDQWVTVAWT